MNESESSMDYFWKKRSVFYFVLSIMVILSHTGGMAYYENAGIEITHFEIYTVNFLAYSDYMLIAVKGFFFFSGLLLFREFNSQNMELIGVVKKCVQRVKRLMIPYMIWNVIYCLWYIFLDFIPFLQTGDGGGRQHFEWNLKSAISGVLFYGYNPHFWYMLQLIIFMVVGAVVYLLIRNKWIGALTCICIYILFYKQYSFYPFLLYEKDAFLFFVLGSYVGLHFFETIRSFSPKWLQKIMFIYLIWFVLYVPVKNVPFVCATACKILFIYAIWIVLDMFKPAIDTISRWWGWDCSFFIYASHGIVQAVVGKILWTMLPRIGSMAPIYVFANASITLIIVLFIARILNKYGCFRKFWKVLN